MALGDPLAEPGMPDPGAVGERPLPVLGRARVAAASRTASTGRMSALGAPRAKQIISGAMAAEYRRAARDAAQERDAAISTRDRAAASVGLSPTRTPFASSASFFASAVPEEPEMIAPAWPICLPGGAVKPAM